MKRISGWLVCMMMLWALSGSAEQKKQPKNSPVKPTAVGEWGGPQVRMNITEAGGTLELNCETTTINEPIKLDENGEFEAKAEMASDGPGPSRVSDDNARPVVLKGKIEGNKMHVEVRFDEQHEPESYDLIRGYKSRLTKCR